MRANLVKALRSLMNLQEIVRADRPDLGTAMRQVEKYITHAVPDHHIVCLCGSTKFYSHFQEANFRETMDGKIVLSVGAYSHSKTEHHGESVEITPEKKIELDALHLQKIDLADEILVLNVGGYVGESTAREILHAIKTEKRVRWFEPDLAKTEQQLTSIL